MTIVLSWKWTPVFKVIKKWSVFSVNKRRTAQAVLQQMKRVFHSLLEALNAPRLRSVPGKIFHLTWFVLTLMMETSRSVKINRAFYDSCEENGRYIFRYIFLKAIKVAKNFANHPVSLYFQPSRQSVQTFSFKGRHQKDFIVWEQRKYNFALGTFCQSRANDHRGVWPTRAPCSSQ